MTEFNLGGPIGEAFPYECLAAGIDLESVGFYLTEGRVVIGKVGDVQPIEDAIRVVFASHDPLTPAPLPPLTDAEQAIQDLIVVAVEVAPGQQEKDDATARLLARPKR